MLHNRHAHPALLAVLLLGFEGNTAHADTSSKSEHTLWNPTPRSGESHKCRPTRLHGEPYTVDAGAFQLEMSFVDYSQTDDAESTTLAPINFKVGLRHDMDIQFVMDPFAISDDGTQKNRWGWRHQIRLKMNLWGNDSEGDAFAFMPLFKSQPQPTALVGTRLKGDSSSRMPRP